MPTYEFECRRKGCGHTDEAVRAIADRDVLHLCKLCGMGMFRVILTAPMGQPDIAPYLGTAGDRLGKPITSRREHREYLKRNNLREVGTDQPKDTRKLRTTKLSHNDRQELRSQIRQELRRKVPRHILEKRG